MTNSTKETVKILNKSKCSFHTTEVETMLYSLDVQLAEISRNNSKMDRELPINKTLGNNQKTLN
jgi:hypothetical protein